MQHERDPLGRRKGVEHDEQSECDRVGPDGLVFRAGPVGLDNERVG